MKNHTKKIFMATVLSLIFLSTFLAVDMISAKPGPPDEDVPGNQYRGKMGAGESKSFRFRNRFRMQLKTNASADVDIECDAEEVGERNFQLEVNTSAGQKVSVKVDGSNTEVNLENGNQIQTRNQNRYRYREKFMVNVSLNETQPEQAKLTLETEEEKTTWAYYDEVAGEWVESASEYVNGAITTVTDHFSVWTVLSPEESEIDAYPLMIGIIGIGIVGLIMKYRKKLH